jgi:hypothetical protein
MNHKNHACFDFAYFADFAVNQSAVLRRPNITADRQARPAAGY